MGTFKQNQNAGYGYTVRNILIVAGEASGDLHGSNLVREMISMDPGLRFYGIGGRRMREEGVELLAGASETAVVGLTEVVSKLVLILKYFFRLKKSLRQTRPDLVILIDYPDFNLPLARAAKKEGLKVFYYISPQVWAWRKKRVEGIKRAVDRIAVILPFETDFYRQAGVEADFVGHPLLDVVGPKYSRAEALESFGLKEGYITVGILPGSRESEVRKILPVMMETAGILAGRFPRIQFILPLADTLEGTLASSILERFPIKVNIIRDAIYDAVNISDAVMVASGTATMETALLETPMIIVYKVSALTYYIGRLFVHVDHIGMVNIIAGRSIVPEFIQDRAKPELMADALADILINSEKRDAMKQELRKVREKLGEKGAARRAAFLAMQIMNK